MSQERMVFIIGSGRSGTTVLYQLLATHPDVAWFSLLTNRRPTSRWAVRMHRLLDVPLVGGALRRSIIERSHLSRGIGVFPSEGEGIYEGHCGFRDDVRSTEEDWRPELEGRLRAVIEQHLEVTRKPVFLSKRTANTQRIRLIARMFPEARYVHIIRDGRAVASSYVNVEWWPDTRLWWAGTTPSEWESGGGDPLELAARHWGRNVTEVLGNREVLGEYLEVRYESLVADPRSVMAEVLAFCQLEPRDGFMERIPSRLPDMNRKWRQTTDASGLETLEEAIGGTLRELGYGD